MDRLATTVARRFVSELLTKQWLMGVRRGWLSLMNVKPVGWVGVFKAFDAVRDFVNNLEEQVLYVRRGPYTSVPSMQDGERLAAEFKKLKEAIQEKRRSATHWMNVENDPVGYGRGSFTLEQGQQMHKLYEEKFGELLTVYVPTKINPAKGVWNPTREGHITELLDRVLEILRADAQRLEKAITTEKTVMGPEGESPTEEAFKEPAFKEFSLGRMKVIVTDPKGLGHHISSYVRILDFAHKRMMQKGFGDLWYGTLFIQSADYKELDATERAAYEKAGYANLKSVAGTFHSGADVVEITAPSDDRTIKTIIHEMGHRYWFKRMTMANRARFEEFMSEGVLPVSEYGGTNAVEAFAEVFAWYNLGKDMTRDQVESFRAVLASSDVEPVTFSRKPVVPKADLKSYLGGDFNASPFTKQTVRIEDLHPSQSTVSRAQVATVKALGSKGPPTVVSVDGKLVVTDGHNRIQERYEAGYKVIEVELSVWTDPHAEHDPLLKKIDELPAYKGSDCVGDCVAAADIFFKPVEHAIFGFKRKHMKLMVKTSVPVKDLYPVQNFINRAQLKHYVEHPATELPIVVRMASTREDVAEHKGKLYAQNHTRIAAQIMKGASHVMVRLIDYTRRTNDRAEDSYSKPELKTASEIVVCRFLERV